MCSYHFWLRPFDWLSTDVRPCHLQKVIFTSQLYQLQPLKLGQPGRVCGQSAPSGIKTDREQWNQCWI